MPREPAPAQYPDAAWEAMQVQFAVAEQAQMESARRNSGSGETLPGAMSHMGKELEDIKRELKDVKAGVIEVRNEVKDIKDMLRRLLEKQPPYDATIPPAPQHPLPWDRSPSHRGLPSVRSGGGWDSRSVAGGNGGGCDWDNRSQVGGWGGNNGSGGW